MIYNIEPYTKPSVYFNRFKRNRTWTNQRGEMYLRNPMWKDSKYTKIF